jgi:hypothetical protein
MGGCFGLRSGNSDEGGYGQVRHFSRSPVHFLFLISLLLAISLVLVIGVGGSGSGGQSSSAAGSAKASPVPSTDERKITFNNNCAQPILVGQIGNAVPGCFEDRDCPGTSKCKGSNPKADPKVSGTCRCSADESCGPGLICDTSGAEPICDYPASKEGGFELGAGQRNFTIDVSMVSWKDKGKSWGGRFFPRTGCTFTTACDPEKTVPRDGSNPACSSGEVCYGGSCLPNKCTTNAECSSVSANAICFATKTEQFGNVCLPHPACQTGDCNGQRDCPPGVGGIPPDALAEFFLTTPSATSTDFYDVSNVDGYVAVAPKAGAAPENIGVEVKPVQGTFVAPMESGACSADSDCTWPAQCDVSTRLCVDAHQCGAPGCANAIDCAAPCPGCGTVLQTSAWNFDQTCGGFAELAAVTPQTCSPTQPCSGAGATCNPAGVCQCTASSDCGTGQVCGVPQLFTGFQACGQFIGCATPDKACSFLCPGGVAGPNCGMSALNCPTFRNPTNNLYGCATGPAAMSCYTIATPAVPDTCCGCPSWTPASKNVSAPNQQLCQNHNPDWQLPSQPETYALAFHKSAPSAYSFAFDDTVNTQVCKGQSASNNVQYQVTFCPQNPGP